MINKATLGFAVLSALALGVVGCSDDDNGTGGTGGTGGSAGTGGSGGAPVEIAMVRVAHLAPDIPAAGDTEVKILVNGEDSEIRLEYGQATGFIEFPADTYNFGIALPDEDEPVFDFNATLAGGQMVTVSAIRTVRSDGMDSQVNVLLFDVSLDGLESGSGRVYVGHGADRPAFDPVDVIAPGDPDCTVLIEDLAFNTVGETLDLPAETYEVGLAAPESCEFAVGPLSAPVTADVATLLVAVDQNTTAQGDPDVVVFAIIDDASGDLPVLEAVTP